ncbi:hypothetical protein J6590_042552 [Homalodisca vitripennis]|nr:hypothetical protein J6590_042552 [Homalodisca vitripennis]
MSTALATVKHHGGVQLKDGNLALTKTTSTRVEATLDGLTGLGETHELTADHNKHYRNHGLSPGSLQGDVIIRISVLFTTKRINHMLTIQRLR